MPAATSISVPSIVTLGIGRPQWQLEVPAKAGTHPVRSHASPEQWASPSLSRRDG